MEINVKLSEHEAQLLTLLIERHLEHLVDKKKSLSHLPESYQSAAVEKKMQQFEAIRYGIELAHGWAIDEAKMKG